MTTIFISNLHSDCDTMALYDKFKIFGHLFQVHIYKGDHQQSLGCGFVVYKLKSSAEKALKFADRTFLKGLQLRVSWSLDAHILESRKSFSSLGSSSSSRINIKNLHPSITDKILFDIFASYGEIRFSNVPVDESGQSKGCGCVHFEDPKSADLAVSDINQKLLRGHKVTVYKCHPRANTMEQATNICLKNLNQAMDDADLRKLCQSFGDIKFTKVVVDENGKSKCYGFVGFSNPTSAKLAIEKLNGSYLQGRKLFAGKAIRNFNRNGKNLLASLREDAHKMHPKEANYKKIIT